MNPDLKGQDPRLAHQSANLAGLAPVIPTAYYLVMVAALIASGCTSDHSSRVSLANNSAYHHQLAVSDVQSFLYFEPATQARVPQVRGSLRNLGNQTLIMVEVTLAFKD